MLKKNEFIIFQFLNSNEKNISLPKKIISLSSEYKPMQEITNNICIHSKKYSDIIKILHACQVFST